MAFGFVGQREPAQECIEIHQALPTQPEATETEWSSFLSTTTILHGGLVGALFFVSWHSHNATLDQIPVQS